MIRKAKTGHSDLKDWLEWREVKTKAAKHPDQQQPGADYKEWNTMADSIAHHPRLAGLVGILPTPAKSSNEKTTTAPTCILNLKAQAKTEVRTATTKAIDAIIQIRARHRKQNWPPNTPN